MDDLLSLSPPGAPDKSIKTPVNSLASPRSESTSSASSSIPQSYNGALSLVEQLAQRKRPPAQTNQHQPPGSTADALFWDSFEGTSSNSIVGDDPFGLGIGSGTPPETRLKTGHSDEDFLGALGQPVTSHDRQDSKHRSATARIGGQGSPSRLEGKLSELVDMGFPEQKARRALTRSDKDVQVAVSWLINEAHEESKIRNNGGIEETGSRDRGLSHGMTDKPHDASLPHGLPVDLSIRASQASNSLFKQATSLWATGSKQVQKAVKNFNQDGNSAKPRWMKDYQPNEDPDPIREQQGGARERDAEARESRSRTPARAQPEVTEEALMLDIPSTRDANKQRPASARDMVFDPEHTSSFISLPKPDPPRSGPELVSKTSRPFVQSNNPASAPKWMQSGAPKPAAARPSRPTRVSAEQQDESMYQSPVRRRRQIKNDMQPIASQGPSSMPVSTDLLGNAEQPTSSAGSGKLGRFQGKLPVHEGPLVTNPRSESRPPAAHKARKPRSIIPLSSQARIASDESRSRGTQAFKKGDYVTAYTFYSSALVALPVEHPLTIPLLANRALTALKNGDPKAARSDAEKALGVIGPSRGEGESIDIDGTPGSMREFWNKALIRKAEALEQLELYSEAGNMWQLAIEAGIGGSVPADGRRRCQSAVFKRGAPSIAPPAVRKGAKKITSSASVAVGSSQAVDRLRASHAAQSAEDDQKFALADLVKERVEKWSKGKETNLRALLSSLDTVLWVGNGWKSVGLNELLLPQRVKIVYMKAVAKVHPDKIGPEKPVEVRMVAENVFDILCRAWDTFRAENGL